MVDQFRLGKGSPSDASHKVTSVEMPSRTMNQTEEIQFFSRRQSISQPGIHDQQPASGSREQARRRNPPVDRCGGAASRSSGGRKRSSIDQHWLQHQTLKPRKPSFVTCAWCQIRLVESLSIDRNTCQVVCTAINSVSRRPVYSKFHLIRIQCESSFGGLHLTFLVGI